MSTVGDEPWYEFVCVLVRPCHRRAVYRWMGNNPGKVPPCLVRRGWTLATLDSFARLCYHTRDPESTQVSRDHLLETGLWPQIPKEHLNFLAETNAWPPELRLTDGWDAP